MEPFGRTGGTVRRPAVSRSSTYSSPRGSSRLSLKKARNRARISFVGGLLEPETKITVLVRPGGIERPWVKVESASKALPMPLSQTETPLRETLAGSPHSAWAVWYLLTVQVMGVGVVFLMRKRAAACRESVESKLFHFAATTVAFLPA